MDAIKRSDSPPRWFLFTAIIILNILNIGGLLSVWNMSESLIWANLFHIDWLLSAWGYSFLLYLFIRRHSESVERSTHYILLSTLFVSVLLAVWLPTQDYIILKAQDVTFFPLRKIIYSPPSQLFFVLMLVVVIHAIYHVEKLYRSVYHRPWFRWTLFMLLVTLCFWMVLGSIALMYRYLNVAMLMITFVPSLVVSFTLAIHVIKEGRSHQIQISRAALDKSYTLFITGIFLLAFGIMGKIIDLIDISPSFFLVLLIALSLLSTFLMILLFPSVKKRIQQLISKNFYKSSYDYRIEWERANERLLGIQDKQELQMAVILSVAESIGTERSCLLIHNRRNRLFVAASAGLVVQPDQISPAFIDWIWRYSKPLILEQVGDLANSLPGFGLQGIEGVPSNGESPSCLSPQEYRLARAVDVALFRESDVRIIVPVIFEQQLIALILLASAKKEYVQEDLDFLQTIVGEIALVLANQKLRESLIESEELKNFNRLSTFVLHDLKNAGSMLKMIVQNADENLNNPEFQADMIRTMNGVTDRIENLISKLSTPTEHEPLEFQSTDLAELIRNTVKMIGIETLPNIRFQEDLSDIPLVRVVPYEIQKVLHNLLINAIESIKDTGKIRVRLLKQGQNVCIEVRDTGCGMSHDYIENNLFRPFHTSKEQGLGIGLYHCKRIVEIHRGQIEVESTLEVGSLFRVLLPLLSIGVTPE
ncbi:GHKL domain-containing protein [Candidatus Poribacteria bacterium]|nr:GHKL domain-containing protein [Candidatus Poribacteria bacterium]